ncbi:hypothetical protein PIIN_01597 [Serendipita indica DSM 11827]|uniref:URB1 N-terminal domain-containing protein n=1 Tax=Serendipita indica (strain DSM 11827) TaxID=1109443 RepID=G4T8Z1_SERID|nr:hypothetical protein PIIN_01597 [Serendipita indica DSM 11827]
MPRLRPQSTAQSRVTKRVEQQEIHDVFTSGEQVLNSLRVTDVQQLVANLIKLRNQWTIRNHELGAISSDDTRLLVAKDYLARSPSAAEVFSAWELLSKQSIVHQHLALGVFASLINLLSTQYAYHNLGLPIVKTLLSPTSSRRLNSHLNSAQTDLVLVALKVWNALSDYGGGMEKLKVYEQFMWSNKSLFRLFHMRRKGQIDLSVDPFIKPDIRTLYIMFLLSFVRSSVAPTIKATFLETQREIFLAIFKRISEDPYPLVKTILEVSWEGIWRDNKIKRTVKIGLFGEQVLSQLTKLYARASLETPDPESKPADVVHHFLLAICTKPGIGICFKDNGWYPRDTGDDQDAEEDLERPSAQQGSSGSKIYNRILGRFIKTLRPTEDARQQELALRILQACPELVAGYFAAIGLSFEPRLSSKWIIAMSWLGSVISLSIPTESFSSSTGNTQEYHSAPPPLLAIMDNVLPSPWSRTYITKGLQSTSSLVQHTTALCLIRAINKFDLIIRLFKKAEEVLAEDPITGQWALRRKEMEKDFRRRTPPFEVIVAFAQQKASNTQWGINVESLSSSQALRGSMTTEAALRLMWLYYKVLPDLPLEARYDVSKLLHGGVGNSFAASLAALSSATRGEIGFDAVCQLHVLRLLQLSDQFIWHTSTGDSQQTQLRQIIHLYMLPTGPILSETYSDLLRSVLAPSPLFEHDPQELNVWLEALPRGARRVNAKDPDGAALADERDTMSLVLDQCIRTCIKSPWRYIEAAQSYYLLAYPAANSSDENHKEALEGYTHFHAASPLLVALLDTFGSILSGSTDSPTSAALAIVTYLRQVILGVSIKQPDEQYAARVANRLERAVSESDKSSHSATLLEGISREIRILRSTLPLSKRPPIGVTVHEGPEVADFLDAVESLHIDPEKGALMAYELVDWVRLSDQNLSPNSIQRAVSLIRDWHPPAMRELLLQLDPSVTPSVALIGGFSTKEVMAFPWLLFHASSAQLHHDDTLELLSSVGARCRGYATQMSCAVLRRRVDHLAGEGNEDILVQHILLWSHILMKLKDPLSRKTHQQWALESDSMQSLLTQDVENGKLISGKFP